MKAGAAAAGFASGAKIPELLDNLKEFILPSPQPAPPAEPATDPVTDPVGASPPTKDQDLNSRPVTAPGLDLPGEFPPDSTEKTDPPVDIELSVDGAPYVPPSKGEECIATAQRAEPGGHDPTVSSQVS